MILSGERIIIYFRSLFPVATGKKILLFGGF